MGRGWCGCWRRRSRSLSVRSAGSTFCGEERATIVRDWNATARAIPSASVPELFAAQVARTPDATAVVFADEQLSYAQLDARANQLAHHLRGLGVGPEVVVGLCVERSLEMMVGLLGILKAGGAYLPLDPDYPPERLAFMMEDARAPVLVTQSALRSTPVRRSRSLRWCGSMPTGPPSRGQPAPRRRTASAQHRLCDLHLGLDRHAEGCRGQHGGIPNLAARQIVRFAIDGRGSGPAIRFAELRCRRFGDRDGR